MGIVGVSFGMARYGYGLLLPDIRRDYGVGPAFLGAVATASYVAYLAATALAGAFAARLGARRTAVTAGVLAAGGMLVAGLSQSTTVFVAGIVVAGASAGFAFAPFGDAARALPAQARGRALAAINCATGYGVALAAPIAIIAGASWRSAWLAFAVLAVLATVWAAHVLPRRDATAGRGGRRWRGVMTCRRALPLLASGALVGLGSAAYWTFAVEHLVDAGSLSSTASRTFLGVVGVASLLATATADLVDRLGSRSTFVAMVLAEAAALCLLALAPSSLTAALLSAVLFGAAYNAALGVQAIWGTRIFARQPSLGIAAVMAANGTGMLLGPLGAGLFAGVVGLEGVLLSGAAVVAAAGLFAPREQILPDSPVRAGRRAVWRPPPPVRRRRG